MIPTLVRCDIHGIEYEVIPKYNGVIGFCPECRKEQLIKKLAEERKNDEASRIAKLKESNIEPMYYDSTLDSFVATNQEQERAKLAVKKLIDTRSGKIVMLGKNGTGKTHLAVAAVKELGGKIFSMYEISTRIRATYTYNSGETELEVVGELSSIPMLVIDEIGRTKGSEAETNWLSYIIDKRHVRGLPLILISNKHTRKSCPDKNGCVNCLENYISEDIMSRLLEDGLIINFTGEDYRISKRNYGNNGHNSEKYLLYGIDKEAKKTVDEELKEVTKLIEEYKKQPEIQYSETFVFDAQEAMTKIRKGLAMGEF